MNDAFPLAQAVGNWAGEGRLHLPWLPQDQAIEQAATTATISKAIGDTFLTISYSWTREGAPQEGLFVIGFDAEKNTVDTAWGDSWHMSASLMYCKGSADENGVLNFMGYYPAPEGPDWGWRMTLGFQPDGTFKIAMFNVQPDGQEFWAVENIYTRQ